MTVRDVLDAMDDEVWVRVRPCTPGHPDDDLVVWSADWLAGGEDDPGIPDGLARYLDCEADDLCIEMYEDPECGDEAPMLVVCAYNSTSEEKKEGDMPACLKTKKYSMAELVEATEAVCGGKIRDVRFWTTSNGFGRLSYEDSKGKMHWGNPDDDPVGVAMSMTGLNVKSAVFHKYNFDNVLEIVYEEKKED